MWFLKRSRSAAAPVKQSEREQAKQSLLDAIPDALTAARTDGFIWCQLQTLSLPD
jgi:SRSO17 transposase